MSKYCHRNYKDRTPLHLAARGGHDTIVKALIEDFNAAVDVVDNNNATPLHFASQEGHLKVATRLLKHGADPGKKMEWKESDVNALDLAIDNKKEYVDYNYYVL